MVAIAYWYENPVWRWIDDMITDLAIFYCEYSLQGVWTSSGCVY